MKKLNLLVFVSVLTLTQCTKDDDKPEIVVDPPASKVYTLVWEDNFDGTGKPDASKWGYEKGFIRNAEMQYYTDNEKNVRMENGVLILEALKEEIVNDRYVSDDDPSWIKNRKTAKYTSASITTRKLVSWKYGKIEVKAKLPKGRGMWPAIWMLGDNIKKVGWPECGEIDIMEHVGYDPNRIHGTVHTKAFNHRLKTQVGKSTMVNGIYNDFHVYSVTWTPKKIKISVDDNVYMTFDNENKTTAEWPFDQKFFMILNVAVGGGWGGQKGIDDSIFPQRMEVDYVKIYELK